MKRLLVLVAAVIIATPLRAQERIKAYDTQVQIRQDGSIDVTEMITVHAEGNSIRRGIYRDFPTRYKDRSGNRVVVGMEVLGVERDGKQEPWFTERKPNGIRINTGNDDFLPVPADYTFTIRYRTTRQIGFFPDHDELYWNAIGATWIFPSRPAQSRCDCRLRCRSIECQRKRTQGLRVRREKRTPQKFLRRAWRDIG